MEAISPEVYERILSADLKNILRKVADGRTLTPAEHARVVARASGATDTVTTARTVGELAQILGTNRRQIARWQHMAGAPVPMAGGTHDVVAWREFVRSRNLKASGVTRGFDWDTLKARKALAEIEDRELKVAHRKGLYVLVSEVEAEWHRRMASLKNLLYAKLTMELPPLCVGKDAIAILQLNRDALDAVLREASETP